MKLQTMLAVGLTVITLRVFSLSQQFLEVQDNIFFFTLLLFFMVVVFGYFFPKLFSKKSERSSKKSSKNPDDFIIDFDKNGGLKR